MCLLKSKELGYCMYTEWCMEMHGQLFKDKDGVIA